MCVVSVDQAMAQTPNTCLISTPGHITTHQAPTNNSCGCNKKPILNPCDVFKAPCSRKSLWLVCFDDVWLRSDNAKANVKVVLGLPSNSEVLCLHIELVSLVDYEQMMFMHSYFSLYGVESILNFHLYVNIQVLATIGIFLLHIFYH